MSHARAVRIMLVVTVVSTALFLVRCPPPPGGEDETIMLPGGVPLEMVWIPAGSSMMGRYPDEQDGSFWQDPQHQVTFTQGFRMGRYEVTKRKRTAVKGTTPWSEGVDVLDDPDSPAVYVSWYDALSFIAQLNGLTGLTFRLPSETQWEYACRAGTTARFYWGDDPSYTAINDYAWWSGNASDAGDRYAHMVGLKVPNAWNLYDMSGNVWEWCEDDSHMGYTGAPTNGAAWVDSPRNSARMLRGGSWYGADYHCRSAVRLSVLPSSTSSSYGFRLAR